jgi:hypothetical protein
MKKLIVIVVVSVCAFTSFMWYSFDQPQIQKREHAYEGKTIYEEQFFLKNPVTSDTAGAHGLHR